MTNMGILSLVKLNIGTIRPNFDLVLTIAKVIKKVNKIYWLFIFVIWTKNIVFDDELKIVINWNIFHVFFIDGYQKGFVIHISNIFDHAKKIRIREQKIHKVV